MAAVNWINRKGREGGKYRKTVKGIPTDLAVVEQTRKNRLLSQPHFWKTQRGGERLCGEWSKKRKAQMDDANES